MPNVPNDKNYSITTFKLFVISLNCFTSFNIIISVSCCIYSKISVGKQIVSLLLNNRNIMTYYKYMLMFQIDVGSGYFAINVILLLESSLSFDILSSFSMTD